MACFSAVDRSLEGAAALRSHGVQGGQAQAQQRVGGGHDGAQPVRRNRGLAQRVLEGGEDLRGAQVGRGRRVDGVEQALRGGSSWTLARAWASVWTAGSGRSGWIRATSRRSVAWAASTARWCEVELAAVVAA